jgi:hypothetical protein
MTNWPTEMLTKTGRRDIVRGGGDGADEREERR